MTPDQWGASNRSYPPGSGHPGPRDPGLTPYMIPFARAVASRRYRWCVDVMFAQGGKTETLLDVVGQRLDQDPVPILWVGPTQKFVNEQFEPRVTALLDSAPSLRAKVQRGKRSMKTRKVVNGVPWRLTHGGSDVGLKSDSFGLVCTDEADTLVANVKKQGDPIALLDARGNTYADFVHAITSTTSSAKVDTVFDEASGLKFWKRITDRDDAEKLIQSKIWSLFNRGTMHHWAVPCPQCSEYFIPRFECLEIKETWTAAQARKMAHLICPHCGGVITEDDKAAMNAKGVAVAPGQTIEDGEAVGEIPDNSTFSMWTSGLVNPFVTLGELAEKFVNARETGSPADMQGVINQDFGEPYWPGFLGATQDWQILMERRAPYRGVIVGDPDGGEAEIPTGVMCVTVGVDVQKMSLRYVVRGWGARARSWLLEANRINGPTAELDVWDDLADVIMTPRDGMLPRLVFVDAGFRPDKKDAGDVHRVYDFARRYPQLVVATRGRATLMTGRPLILHDLEIKPDGKSVPFSIKTATLDTDHFKSLVWSRIAQEPDRPGTFYVPKNVTEGYCREVASEVREIVDGKPSWRPMTRENHFFDCEAMASAAAYLLNVQRIPDGARRPSMARDGAPPRFNERGGPQSSQTPPTPAGPAIRRSGFLGDRGRGFLGR